MTRSTIRSIIRPVPARALALAGLLSACGGADTVVLVMLEGQLPAIHHFQVEATVGEESKTLQVPEAPEERVFLPVSFTLQIPRSRSGTLALTVIAVDAAGVELARESDRIEPITPGGRHDITLVFGGPKTDAGPDGRKADADVDAVPGDVGVDTGFADRPADRGTPDAGADTVDAALDASVEDPGVDAPGEAAVDAGPDAPPEDMAPPDAGEDRSPDAAADPAADAGDAVDASTGG